MGASSRIRTLQYLPHLSRFGIQVEVDALLGESYLQTLYDAGKRPVRPVIEGAAHRIVRLARRGRYDLVWLEKEAFPWLPGTAERALALTGCPYLVDYDDAIFHTYDQDRRRIVRALLGGKIRDVMERAKVVTVGNDYLAEYAHAAGASNVVQLPSVIDLNRYQVAAPHITTTTRFGWIGTPQTQHHLDEIGGVLGAVSKKADIELVTVGAKAITIPGIPTSARPWSEATEVEEIQRIDVGVMPLRRSPFAEGKCGYKLIQYMACGLPTIASPTRANASIVEHGVTGFIASSASEWVDAMLTLASDPVLRARMGRAGRAKVEAKYALQVTGPILASIILGVLE